MARKRKSGFRKQKSNILIVCEGSTEKLYLDKLKSYFRLTAVDIEVKNAKGGSALQVFNLAHRITGQNRKNKQYSSVYCVFDHDNKSIDTELLPALNQILKSNYIPIYSNISFELWLCMHYESYHLHPVYSPEKLLSELMVLDQGYHKTNYNIDEYIKCIPIAIQKSQKIDNNCSCPQKIKDLKVNPYTNMRLLIQNLEEERKR